MIIALYWYLLFLFIWDAIWIGPYISIHFLSLNP